MKPLAMPHYHVVCRESGEVWTYGQSSEAVYVGRTLVRSGWRVDRYACVNGKPCPEEVVYRWKTGRPMRIDVPSVGRRRPRKSTAYARRVQTEERLALLEGGIG
jgi:hypothetical protein